MIKPTGNNIMVRLPTDQKKRERKIGNIYIPTLEGRFEHDFTFGEVVSVGELCTTVKVNDIAYYSQMSMQQALQNCGRDKTRNDTLKDTANNIPCYLYEEGDEEFLIFPASKVSIECSDISGTFENIIFQSVICIIRDGKVVMLNDNYLINKDYDDGQLIDGIRAKRTQSGLYLPQLKEQNEKDKKYKVLHAPEKSVVDVGDTIFTQPHCDIPLEGEFNNPLFPKDTYYIQESNILAVQSPSDEEILQAYNELKPKTQIVAGLYFKEIRDFQNGTHPNLKILGIA